MSGPRRPPGPPPLPDDLALVLIDGDNLLHRVRGTRDEGSVRWLLPRLREWRPHGVHIVLVLDGHPEPGETLRRQVVTGIEVHHSGGVDGDTALLKLLGARPYADRIRTVLVTDDRALSDRARHLHAWVRRLDWFVGQLVGGGSTDLGASTATPDPGARPGGSPGARPGGSPAAAPARPTGVGAGRPPRRVPGMVGGDPSRESDGEADRPAWRPGRGATRKVGNPRRGHGPAHGPGGERP